MRRKTVVLGVAILTVTIATLLGVAASVPTLPTAPLPCLSALKPEHIDAYFQSDLSGGRPMPRGASDVTMIEYRYRWYGDEKALAYQAQAEMLARNFQPTVKPGPSFSQADNMRISMVSGSDAKGNTLLLCAVVKPSAPDASTLIVCTTHLTTTAEKVQQWMRRTFHWNGNLTQSRSNVKWRDRP